MSSLYKYFDEDRYQKAYQLFLERTNEEQCTNEFIQNTLPDILASIGNGKPQLNVIGVGSGDGKFDLKILSQLSLKHPGVLVDNEVIEPNSNMLHAYRAMVDQKPDLEHIKFSWNMMTDSEFEEQWRQKNITKKADFIHMVQMLYYVKDVEATIKFYQSLLDKNGKLMIILASDESAIGKMRKNFSGQLSAKEHTHTSTDIRKLLDTNRVPYQCYDIQAHLDLTECYTEGDDNGELLLDFVTQVQGFHRTASPELKQKVLSYLRDPQCSEEKDGRVLLKHIVEIMILDGLN